MGWSCRQDAMNTLNKIQKALCIGKSSNEFCIKGTTYMWEVSRKEHDDGAITGEILNLTNWTGRVCNTFRISPEGKVDRGPKAFKDAAEGKKITGLSKPPD